MALPSSIWQRGNRASQPAATAVAAGTIYYVTDESVTERSTGSAWEDVSDAGAGDVSDGDTLATGLTFPNTGLHLLDTNASHDYVIVPGTNITADRNLTIYIDDAATSVTFPIYSVVGITIDGGGSAITTGVKGFIEVPFAGTITQATVLLDQSGSIVIDVWKDVYANYPPTDADSITAAAPPTVTTATNSQDSTLTGWTTSVAAGDILGFNVDSITTATRATLVLKIRRT